MAIACRACFFSRFLSLNLLGERRTREKNPLLAEDRIEKDERLPVLVARRLAAHLEDFDSLGMYVRTVFREAIRRSIFRGGQKFSYLLLW